ncbi:MAG: hypothetical protein RL220_635 [Bacteroidota bacterium]|jgi:hypothetical protein
MNKFYNRVAFRALPFLAILGVSALFSGCKKTPDYVNPVYSCGCGAMSWVGTQYPLLDANYIIPIEGEALSRRYYCSADVQIEGETGTHNVNLIIEISDVSESVIYVGDDEVEMEIVAHEVNENDPILPVRTYVATDGVVQISPALLGGNEPVSFNLIVRELYDGDLVGFEKALTGNLNVLVSY